MRNKIVAGNWKMNNDFQQTRDLLISLKNDLSISEEVEVIVAPTFTNLSLAASELKGEAVSVAAQNMHQSDSGAFTGEVSASMLLSIGVHTVIIGHSERRIHFGETNDLLAEKLKTGLKNDMRVIFCFGEELQERKNGNHFKVVEEQLEKGIFHINASAWKQIILAYEPVWAIGTGETATPEQAQEMHAFIREKIAEAYSNEIAENVAILYGGSVKPENAKEIFSKPDVDGGLIGGASLQADSFSKIASAAV